MLVGKVLTFSPYLNCLKGRLIEPAVNLIQSEAIQEIMINKMGIARKLTAASCALIVFFAACFILSETVPAAASLQSSDVVLYRGNPQRTGAFNEPGIRQMTGVKWQASFGGGLFSSPVFSDGVLYIPSGDGRLYAFDSNTGQRLWSFKAKPLGGLLTSVALADGVVYVGIERKRLYAIDAVTGQKLWQFKKAKGIIWTAPLVVANTIYFASDDGNFFAVDTTTHAQRWKINTGRRSLSPPVYDNGTIFFQAENFLYAVDSETGQEKWKIEKPTDFWWDPPAVANGLIYAGNGDGKFHALNRETGAEVWSHVGDSDAWSAPAIADGTVYVGNKDTFIYAIDAQTGERLWRFKAEDWATSDPVVSGGVVYFGVANHENREGQRYFYALDAQTGQELWKFKADSRLFGSPAVGGGAVYFTSFNGTTYALQ